ncbi:hypothetical protein M422DRAFT_269758, partial [Sphaerobolus stellatus SS14]
MNIDITKLNYDATLLDVKKALAKVLHSKAFSRYREQRELQRRSLQHGRRDIDRSSSSQEQAAPARPYLLNFHLTLTPSTKIGYKNDGSGLLTLPTQEVGEDFLSYVTMLRNKVIIRGHRIFFSPSEQLPWNSIVEVINKVSFQDPDVEAQREELSKELNALDIRLSKVFFGAFCLTEPSVFSKEWERDCLAGYPVSGALKMEWEHKLLRVCLEALDDDGTLIRQEIIVRFQDIRDIFTGADSFNSYILFKLYCAPSFEEVPVYRTMNGDKHDNRNFKHRVSHLDDAHRVIAAYNPHLCVILHDSFDLTGFNQACGKAKIYKPRVVQFYLEKRNFFSPQRVQAIGAWYRRLNCWPVAFQVEALLRNGLMNTEELKTILGPTEAYYGRHGAEATVALLRAFNERIQRFTPNQKPVDILTKLSQDNRRRLLHADNQGTHMCYHVTVTPTRIFLEGPYPDVSNSIVSKYDPEYFLRVSFKDEDEHQYRWDRA